MITWHVQYCSCETERFVYRSAIFFLTETKLGDLLSWLRSILLMWHFFSFFILGTGMLQKVCIIDITSWSFYLLCHTKHITDQSHLISTLSIDGAIVVFVSVHTRNSLTVTQPPLPSLPSHTSTPFLGISGRGMKYFGGYVMYPLSHRHLFVVTPSDRYFSDIPELYWLKIFNRSLCTIMFISDKLLNSKGWCPFERLADFVF